MRVTRHDLRIQHTYYIRAWSCRSPPSKRILFIIIFFHSRQRAWLTTTTTTRRFAFIFPFNRFRKLSFLIVRRVCPHTYYIHGSSARRIFVQCDGRAECQGGAKNCNNDDKIRCHAHAERGGRRRLDALTAGTRNDNIIIYIPLQLLPIITYFIIILILCKYQ